MTGAFAAHATSPLPAGRALRAGGSRNDTLVSTDQAARIALEVANQLKAEFAANLGHEIKAPLDTIAGLTRCLSTHGRRKLADADIVDCARLIEDSARHVAAFLAGILDLANLECGRCPLNLRDLRLDGILTAAVSAQEDTAREAGVRIVSFVPYELPIVRGDAAKLYQAFGHVIASAIAASTPGGTVTVDASATSDSGIAVFVRDSGAGMSEEEMALALRPLGHLDSSRTQLRDGARLKIRIAKALIELHGGCVTMANAAGWGTEVVIVLPPAVRASRAG